MTEWRHLTCSPYRRYQVSDEGVVRRDGRELAGYVDRYGYRTVLLSYAGLSKRFKVHRLVCETFHGPCPDGKECGHLDGDPGNNRAANLAWVTRSENGRHRVLHGTHFDPSRSGESHHAAKITARDAAEIRTKATAGMSGGKLAKEYGIGRNQVNKIVRGLNWTPQGDAHD